MILNVYISGCIRKRLNIKEFMNIINNLEESIKKRFYITENTLLFSDECTSPSGQPYSQPSEKYFYRGPEASQPDFNNFYNNPDTFRKYNFEGDNLRYMNDDGFSSNYFSKSSSSKSSKQPSQNINPGESQYNCRNTVFTIEHLKVDVGILSLGIYAPQNVIGYNFKLVKHESLQAFDSRTKILPKHMNCFKNHFYKIPTNLISKSRSQTDLEEARTQIVDVLRQNFTYNKCEIIKAKSNCDGFEPTITFLSLFSRIYFRVLKISDDYDLNDVSKRRIIRATYMMTLYFQLQYFRYKLATSVFIPDNPYPLILEPILIGPKTQDSINEVFSTSSDVLNDILEFRHIINMYNIYFLEEFYNSFSHVFTKTNDFSSYTIPFKVDGKEPRFSPREAMINIFITLFGFNINAQPRNWLCYELKNKEWLGEKLINLDYKTVCTCFNNEQVI
jgi:hypothetical protein